ncbi:MAG: DNA polymerase III subunit beta [Fusobacteriaceae bacterium]
MEVKVNRIEFLKKLKIVEKAISDNKIKPIISCVYIETEKEGLKFYGTNLEITIITTMESEVKETGKMVFQYQIVEEYLKELKDTFVVLKVTDTTLTIETEDSSTEFSLMEAEEFPKSYLSSEINNGNIMFEMKSSELIEAYEKTKFSASQSTDDMRINCIRMEAENKIIKFVGTDTYRLVYLEKEVETDETFSISLPLNSVDAITKLFRSLDSSNVVISIGNKNIKFEIDGTLVISRIIDMPFPDYEAILKNLNYNKKLKIIGQEFMNMLKRVIIFVRNNNDSKFGAIFEVKDRKITISGANEIAKINEEAKVDYDGETLKIALNTKFLIEFLQNLDMSETINLEFVDSNGSVKITQEDKLNYLYIVMPLALREVQ